VKARRPRPRELRQPADGRSLGERERLMRAGPRLGSRVPSLEGYILPGAGHNLNVMPDAREWFGVLASASPWRKEPPDQRA
jgi:hypothetical protein